MSTLRPVVVEDLPAIAQIYGHHVENGLATWEFHAPDLATMKSRYDASRAVHLPWLAALEGEQLLGFAYASPYRLRPGWAYTVEDSVYLSPQACRRGLGSALLEALIAACSARGMRQMVAVIGDSDNHASRALHRRCGFHEAGILAASGWKFGRWVDAVLMQRSLGPGASSDPQQPGCVAALP